MDEEWGGAGSTQQATGPAQPGRAHSRVAGPAIGLMITACAGAVAYVVGCGLAVVMTQLEGGGMGRDDQLARWVGGGFWISVMMIGVAVSAVIFIGAWKMKDLRAYPFAIIATLIAVIPCVSPCCLLGLPIGIWSLVVLLDPDVKAAFVS